MHIRTIEENFEHQVEKTLKTVYNDFKDSVQESGLSFQDWLWIHPEELGKAFYERIDEYMSIDEACDNIVE